MKKYIIGFLILNSFLIANADQVVHKKITKVYPIKKVLVKKVIPLATSTILIATTTPKIPTSTDIYIDGIKITSPLTINGFYQETVRGERMGKTGSYNRFTKIFTGDEEVYTREQQRQEEILKEQQIRQDKLNSSFYIQNINLLGYSELQAIDGLQKTHTIRCIFYKENELNQAQLDLGKVLDELPRVSTSRQYLNNIYINHDINPNFSPVYLTMCGTINNLLGDKSYIWYYWK